MLDEIEYWLKFGVDGFRFDVINFLITIALLETTLQKIQNL